MTPETTPEKSREAQLVIVVGLLLLSLIFKIPLLTKITTALGLIFVFVPFLTKYIVQGWFALSHALGWFNSRVLLTVAYFVFLVPFAFLARIFGKGSLQLKDDKPTVFTDRNHLYTKKDLENIW